MFLLPFHPEHLSKQLTAEQVDGRGWETERDRTGREERERDWSRKE